MVRLNDEDYQTYNMAVSKLNYLIEKHGYEEIYGLLYDDIPELRG